MNVSIIIPSFNGKTLLEKNLKAVEEAIESWNKNGKSEDSEVIVVDDASTDGTLEWLHLNYPKIQVVRNSQNLRFAESCNRGVSASSGEVVVLLNNDVEPKTDFLVPLLKHFSDLSIFAVGCREINKGQGKEILGGRGVSSFRRGLVIHWRPVDQESSTVTWVSGGSAAFRRSTWIQLGGFDRLFRPAYEEDRDICWQALKAGFKIVFEPQAQVRHDHETTSKKIFGSWKIQLYSLKNQFLFVWKNISSPSLLFQHLFWLPYHLLFTSWRSNGAFLMAFLWALWQFPEALASRTRASKFWKRSDEEILSMDQG